VGNNIYLINKYYKGDYKGVFTPQSFETSGVSVCEALVRLCEEM